MDFVTGLPRPKSGNDTICVIADRLTKSAVFIPIKETWKKKQLAKVYVKNVVRLHGVPKNIISDRDSSYHASIVMAPFEALYGRKCRSPVCWNDYSENLVLGTEYIEEMVSPTKGVMRFGKKGKLSAKYVSPYEILERVGKVSYKLALPTEFEKMHDVFHISQMKKYVPDPKHVLQPESIQLDETLTYEEKPVKILDYKVRSTRNKDVRIVKVIWSNQEYEEATWEAEDDIRKRYPELFNEINTCRNKNRVEANTDEIVSLAQFRTIIPDPLVVVH
ncbi:uncharacterized protein LOC110694390 [Chenopodium quinoa]|uniref:uncharacterized protein LOC110694390 n=1 Tax=Chenopodium quinoa TaxID=63459 RepID=UPI000B770E17|nr:uncharacterized protein LOC110694390 [Chenopodium quinoa]